MKAMPKCFRVWKAWNAMERKDEELRGSSNGVINDYHKWLKARTQGITWLSKLKISSGEEAEVPEEREEVQALKVKLERTRVVKEKFKMTAIRVWKDCKELRDVNMVATEALERETKRARKEEWGQNKFRGALWAATVNSSFEGLKGTSRGWKV